MNDWYYYFVKIILISINQCQTHLKLMQIRYLMSVRHKQWISIFLFSFSSFIWTYVYWSIFAKENFNTLPGNNEMIKRGIDKTSNTTGLMINCLCSLNCFCTCSLKLWSVRTALSRFFSSSQKLMLCVVSKKNVLRKKIESFQ